MNPDIQGILLADAMRDFGSRVTPENVVEPGVQEIVQILRAYGRGDFRRVRFLVFRKVYFHPYPN